MSVQSEQLMRRLWQAGGVIVRQRGAQLLAIHPRGDRRCKRMGWIETVDALDWLQRGVLVEDKRGYRLSDDVIDRLRHGQTPKDIEAALHQAARERRPRNATPQVFTMDKLTDRDGNRVFTDAQVEAARRFARDLKRAGQGGAERKLTTSDMAAPRVDGTRRHDRVESAAVRRLDAGRAVARAKTGLDGRVVRVLTRVIGADETLEDVDRVQGWGAGVGAMLMQIGLDHLARHYGVTGR